jgi:hypothetical protein
MVLQPVGRTKPDLGVIKPDLGVIKQVEQGTTLFLEEPARDLAGFGAHGSKEAVEILVFPIWQLFGLAEGALLRSARPAILPAAPVISGTEPLGRPTCCAASFVETAT